ncbi:Spo0B domain-containing protein [Thalassobacillus pellis]|uniref:Spo0B domain-containing protein n=1 Tax=Thalassobacillus pellis TaxID=748008 RepID=UPI001960406F|nr:Spo0B domain-containing protein [Thalassobacillus pellis]MBM7554628.1 stage 0 sporulation protein B (sporulation initiation phosphotransferase) [Thalassobacillus pellis]
MQADEVIRMLRHARHDWMNQLQLIQGYASMGKEGKMKDKINEVIASAEDERRLMNIKAPYLTLWLISFNWDHPYYRLSYKVNVDDVDLSHRDITMYAYCEELIRIFERFSDPNVLYKGELNLEMGTDQYIRLLVTLTGDFKDQKKLHQELQGKRFIYEATMKDLQDTQQFKVTMNVDMKR